MVPADEGTMIPMQGCHSACTHCGAGRELTSAWEVSQLLQAGIVGVCRPGVVGRGGTAWQEPLHPLQKGLRTGDGWQGEPHSGGRGAQAW